jgi:hypothetical protein
MFPMCITSAATTIFSNTSVKLKLTLSMCEITVSRVYIIQHVSRNLLTSTLSSHGEYRSSAFALEIIQSDYLGEYDLLF